MPLYRKSPMTNFKFLLFTLLFMSIPLQAKIFKWVDESGVAHYSETKPENIEVKEFNVESYETVSFQSYENEEATEDEDEINNNKFKPIKRNPKLTRKFTKKVIMYSTEWCGYCKKARKHFKKQGIRYTEYDIDKSKNARARYNKLGGKGVPVILVGKKRMNGFSEVGFNRIYR